MKIKDYLKVHQQWCKGQLRNNQGRVCLLGALSHCYPNLEQKVAAQKKLEHSILKLYQMDSIVNFNDDPKTSFEDVQKVIKLANV